MADKQAEVPQFNVGNDEIKEIQQKPEQKEEQQQKIKKPITEEQRLLRNAKLKAYREANKEHCAEVSRKWFEKQKAKKSLEVVKE